VTAPVGVQGYPLLVQAATDSVRKSKFESRNYADEAVFYRDSTYSFQLGPTSYWAETTNGISSIIKHSGEAGSGEIGPQELAERRTASAEVATDRSVAALPGLYAGTYGLEYGAI